VLIHIKSKMLLPRDPLAPADAQEDPRNELVNRLLEHEKFKSAAQMLLQKQQIEDAVLSNPRFASLWTTKARARTRRRCHRPR